MPHPSEKGHRAAYATLCCIGLLALLPFLLLTVYNHPQADDFGLAVRDRSHSLWETQVNYYMHWSGRYFATATAAANPTISGDFERYKLYSFVAVLLLPASIFVFVRKLLHNRFNLLQKLALAALLLCLYLLQMPRVSEGVFWLTGFLAYQLPNVLLLLLLTLLLSFFRTEDRGYKIIYIVMAIFTCVAIVGANEMSLLMTFTTILFINYYNRNDKKNSPYLLSLFIFCALACLVSVAAPGNYVRLSSHLKASKPLLSISYAAFLTILSFVRWLGPLLVATVLYVLYWGMRLADKTEDTLIFKVDLRLSAGCYLTTLFLMQFTFTWAVGERPTPRVDNVIYFYVICGWLYNVQVALCKYNHLLKAERELTPALPLVLLLLLLSSVFEINGTIATAYIDLLSGKAAAYDNALNKRYAYLKTSGCDPCKLPPLPAVPQTLQFIEIQEGEASKTFWVNSDIANYWGKSAVYLSAPNPEAEDNFTTLKETAKRLLEK